jgi:nitrite reductase/ring-hydroxylating ferredoxin subunit
MLRPEQLEGVGADQAAYDAPDQPIDPLVDTAGREGLTGTAPATLYTPLPAREQITLPPDGRPPGEQPPWRQDFPIDWPQDQYVARRDFSKFMVLTSLAFVAGQLWIGIQNYFRRRRGAPPIQRVAALGEVPVGGAVEFTYPAAHDPCLLIRPKADALLAYSQSCTHLSCAVVPRVGQNEIHCPCHDGHFDLQTGRPIAGPPRRPLTRILIEVRDGAVYATGLQRRTV